MTFVMSAACGGDSVGALQAQLKRLPAADGISFVRHEDLAVAWASTCPWIDVADDGDVLIVIDGRLHNLSSPAAGQAELLLRRYRDRGADVARGLLGDFVIVVLDRRTMSLLVARDPVGVRPWYQASLGDRHAGATDMATLAELPWVDTAVNDRIAIEYLAAVWESRGDTIYQGIRTLQPGLTWQRTGQRVRSFPHHRWELRPERDISWPDAAERCRVRLDEAVACRLNGAGPATSDLSGGLDSASVVGTIAMRGRDDLTVGRLTFDTPRADEHRFSDAVIDHWGLPAVSVAPWMPSAGESAQMARALRRPVPDPHFTMFASLHRSLLAEGRPESLTGLGGDDAFATCWIGSRVVSAVQLRQSAVLGSLARSTVAHPRQAWAALVRPTLHHLAPWRGDSLPAWVTAPAAARADLPRLLRRRPERVTRIDAIDERIANLTSGYDACILEARAIITDWVGRRESHPFLDPRFIEATYGLDPSWPTRGGHTRALQVEAFRDRLPPAVADRRSKADFSEVFWPQLLDGATLRRVRNGPLHELGWLDRAGFDGLVVRAKEGEANTAIPLSRCVSLDRWFRNQ